MLLMVRSINSCSSKVRFVCHPKINDKGEHSNCGHQWHGSSSNLRSNAKCRIKSGSSYLARYDLSYMDSLIMLALTRCIQGETNQLGYQGTSGF
jgi:hypothetical protein